VGANGAVRPESFPQRGWWRRRSCCRWSRSDDNCGRIPAGRRADHSAPRSDDSRRGSGECLSGFVDQKPHFYHLQGSSNPLLQYWIRRCSQNDLQCPSLPGKTYLHGCIQYAIERNRLDLLEFFMRQVANVSTIGRCHSVHI